MLARVKIVKPPVGNMSGTIKIMKIVFVIIAKLSKKVSYGKVRTDKPSLIL